MNRRAFPGACLLLVWLLAGLADASPVIAWRVITEYPRDPDTFTQGLQLDGNTLLHSGGLYGRSSLQRTTLDGFPLARAALPGDHFAEGVTRLRDRVYLLTWREGTLWLFTPDLQPVQRIRYSGEGWGITHDGHALITSDGSDQLRWRDATDFRVTRTLSVHEDGLPVTQLNELEYVDGLVFANLWQSDRIVVISPDNGQVLGHLDLAGLLPEVLRQPGTDVLNGIAWDPERRLLLVTGKRWPRLYALELLPDALPGWQNAAKHEVSSPHDASGF